MVGYTRLLENLKFVEWWKPNGSIEILEDVSFRVTLKDWGSKWKCLPFCWTNGWIREDNRIREHWFWNGG